MVVLGATVVVVVVTSGGGGAGVVLLVVVGTAVVVVVLQHTYAGISCHLPTLGIFCLKIKLPATTLPEPSILTNALSVLLGIGAIIIIVLG